VAGVRKRKDAAFDVLPLGFFRTGRNPFQVRSRALRRSSLQNGGGTLVGRQTWNRAKLLVRMAQLFSAIAPSVVHL
jgi:hypothetical protein